jgi:hypothetical protein
MPFKALEALKWIKHTKNTNLVFLGQKLDPYTFILPQRK